jgi:MFS family permease
MAILVLGGWEELWSVFLLTALAGTVTALENPSRRAFVVDIVDEDDVANAVGLNSALMTGARVVGPAVGGLLIAGPGIAWCFAVNALTYVPQIVLFARMDRSRFRPHERVAKAKGQLREGLRYAWGDPELRLPLLLVTAVGTLAFNFAVIIPLFATRDLGGDDAAVGWLFSVMSVGSVLGALAVARRTTADTAFLARASLVMGVALCVFAAAPNLPLAYVLSLPAGFTSIYVISGMNAVVQLRAIPSMRGRVLALTAVVFLGSTPIGGPIVGWISEMFGARIGLVVGGATCLVAGALVLRALRPDHAPRLATDQLSPASTSTS